MKNNVDYIDNSNINDSHLNRSRLHLNNAGDKMLGKNLCAYLKPKGRAVNNNVHDPSRNVNRAFCQGRYSNHVPLRPAPPSNKIRQSTGENI